MIEIKRLKKELNKFPEDACAFGYEGEVCGIIITNASGRKQLGYIVAEEDFGFDEETVVYKKEQI